jgi:hypothetical protein
MDTRVSRSVSHTDHRQTAMPALRDFYSRIEEDGVRSKLGWSPDFERSQVLLLDAKNDEDRARVLGEWLGSHQPCLFGKIAVRKGMICDAPPFATSNVRAFRARWL